MYVSNNEVLGYGNYDSNSNYGKNNDSINTKLKEAIKAYRDEYLTGLTDEEREEIEKLAKAYLEKHPIRTEGDRAAFDDYIKSLLKQFGYKGDVLECSASIIEGIQCKREDLNNQAYDINITAGEKSVNNDNQKDADMEMIDKPDGERILMIRTSNGVRYIKIREATDSLLSNNQAHENMESVLEKSYGIR